MTNKKTEHRKLSIIKSNKASKMLQRYYEKVDNGMEEGGRQYPPSPFYPW